MHSLTAIALQGMTALMAIAIAGFCPHPGSASRLVSLGSARTREAAIWASSENAQLLSLDPQSQSFTVISPTASGLLHALSYGFLPIAAQPPSCVLAQDGSTYAGAM